ncbi:MAG: hypothetical protein KAT91_02845, partial [Candidatus Aenigmarchaeota archaeon]|nr:hypothetical protein [Candidatus Aenigmarchaeota archaeon]
PFRFTVHDQMTGLFIADKSCLVSVVGLTYPCGKGIDATKINENKEQYHTNINLKELNKGQTTITASILGTKNTFEIVVK